MGGNRTSGRQDAKEGRAANAMSETKPAKPAEQPTPAQYQPKSFRRWAWEWVKSIAVAVVIWLVLRTFLVEAFRIPSSSMERTLLVGDFLFVNKALYGAEVPLLHTHLPSVREPRRGDIVVFDSRTEQGVKVVKRVIGVGGDTLEMRTNVLYRNGAQQVEPFAQHVDPASDPSDPEMRLWQTRYLLPTVEQQTYQPTRGTWGPLVVPPGQYFVMGDNR